MIFTTICLCRCVVSKDEKGGPIAAKTYGGPSWCSTQAKIEQAQKTKGIMNDVFGIYDYTNDRMFIYLLL
jgi:hypothetical protein